MEELVISGYNTIAQRYVAGRDALKSGKYIQKLLKLLPKKATVLDIGCGAGLGVDDYLLKVGNDLIGIDNSIEMIRLARRNCPAGEYKVEDMRDLVANEYSVDAIVSFYALFHVARSSHKSVLQIWASFLRKDGLLLLTMGDRAFEGVHSLYGVKMWSSQWGVEKNLELVREVGFEIVEHNLDTSGAERHLVVLARKR